jgi:hypothetical protein
LFYILLDASLIKEKSDNAYKSLSDELTQARLDPDYNYKGKPKEGYREGQLQTYLLGLDALRDESRPSYEHIPTQTPEEFVTNEIVRRIREPERYYVLPRWHNQKHFVIIVIEKSALYEDFLTIILQNNLQVMLFALGGYYGTTDYSHLYDILVYQQRHLGKSVHILYFGDYDGHGLAIDKNVTEKLEKIAFRYMTEDKVAWYLRTSPKWRDPLHGDFEPLPPEQQDFSFERLAVTFEQIEEHHLHVLNQEVFASSDSVERRFRQDTTKRDFTLNHRNGRNFVYLEVEVDGIVSSRWDIVERLVVDNVLKYWDEQIYESVKHELTIERVRQEIASRITLRKKEDREREFEEEED